MAKNRQVHYLAFKLYAKSLNEHLLILNRGLVCTTAKKNISGTLTSVIFDTLHSELNTNFNGYFATHRQFSPYFKDN
jgi:hypothetical protein